jgi:DNA helicase IV
VTVADDAWAETLSAEQEHLAYVRTCLEAMVDATAHYKAVGGDKIATEMLEENRLRRLESLQIPGSVALFFGRIDGATGADGGHQSFHIGRRHIRNAVRDAVVVDWRAPVARTFYQASRAHPMGLTLRRRFGFQDGRITGLEDELFDQAPPRDAAEEAGLSPLVAAEIERPRTGAMRDIVATIQPDQDEIVRLPLDVSVCVQDAPGTGKTAVGLHRAAYLLYAFEGVLRKEGVLVLGPNEAFIHYVNQVLPALGEINVDQMSLGELLTTVPVRREEDEEVAALKHDARMAEVIARSIASRMVAPDRELVVRVGITTFHVEPDRLAAIRDLALRRGVPYEAGRKVFQNLVVDHLLARAELVIGGVERSHVTRALREAPAGRELLDALWPPQDATSTVFSLLTDPAALAAGAGDLLDEGEQALLLWKSSGRAKLRKASAPWSAADLVLLDEAAGVIARPRAWGHVIVDEAQDLSPMQLRAIGRRCLRSLTVLGDLAQATTPWRAQSWEAVLGHLGAPGTRIEPLSRAFRLQASVVTVANRLLAHIAPGLPPSVPVRDASDALSLVPVGAGGPDLLAHEVASRVVASLEHPGSIGVVVPATHWEKTVGALRDNGVSWGPVGEMASGQRVTLVAPEEVKGLEFDVVVLVEPAAIAGGGDPASLRLLYIALTRAVLRLVVIHAEPLPHQLVA